MSENDFKKTLRDHCVFVNSYENGDFMILLLYMDNMLIIGHDQKKIVALKKALSKSFAMKDLGLAKQILGMKTMIDPRDYYGYLRRDILKSC